MIDVSPDARYAIALGAIFPDAVNRFEERIAATDWAGALSLVRRARRLEVLDGWRTERRIGAGVLRELLPGAWREAAGDGGTRWWPLFREANYCGNPPPAADPILGFRGGQRDDPLGMAWWIDLDAARRDALRWPRSAANNAEGEPVRAGFVITAAIPRDKIGAAFVGRWGTEVIAHPRSVTILGRERIEEPLQL